MWGWSTPLNTAWCCIAFASSYSISSTCSPLSTLNILCRSAAMQGAYMCAGLNWSLSSFPFSTLFCLWSSSFPFHFSFPGGRQDDDDDAASTNGPCWDSDFGCKEDFMGILHFTYQPSWEKKKEKDHTLPLICLFFQGPLLELFLPCNICKSAWTWLFPPVPQHVSQSIRQYCICLHWLLRVSEKNKHEGY